MLRAIVVLAVAVALATGTSAQAPDGQRRGELEGKLYRSVFFSGPGALSAADLESVPAAVRARLERYLRRRTAFASQLQGAASTFDDVRAEAKKRVVERAIVALVEAAGIERVAAAYAQNATILFDWKRSPAPPLSEAAAAEDFLKQNPTSPIAPYLYVFIAERQRAAFELMTPSTQKADMTAASRKYRVFMQRARAAEDAIFRLLADDMDRLPFLYTKSDTHPRDFDPDG